MGDKRKNSEQSNFVIETLDDEWQCQQEIDFLNIKVSRSLDIVVNNMSKQMLCIGSSIVFKTLLNDLQSVDLEKYQHFVEYFCEVIKVFGVKIFYYSSVLISIWYFIKWVDNFLYAYKIQRKVSGMEKKLIDEFLVCEVAGFNFDAKLFEQLIEEAENNLVLKKSKHLK